MKNLLLILFIFGCSFSTVAQSKSLKASKRDQIEAQKVSYITSLLKLTPEEAQQFWPLYNAYQKELDKLRREGNHSESKLYDKKKEVNSAELDKLMQEHFAKQRARIDLDEKYYEKYKKVLSPSKLAEFYRAERSFKRELIDRLREKPGGARPE